MSLHPILVDCGLTITHHEVVHGGDINDAYCLYTDKAKYFLKVNDARRYPGMFEKEASGLLALGRGCSLTIPRVIKAGVVKERQYLLMEWLEGGTPGKNFWQDFGAGLAALHQNKSTYFGWEGDNFIGSLPQNNPPHKHWHLFYKECRIMPQVQRLVSSGAFDKTGMNAAENFCDNITNAFPPEPPALLHGDLWSGNFMVAGNGYAAIYDPAVYYGHREMDIGMTCLFGGFQQQFYDAYNHVYPLGHGWQQRLPLTQLYPLLVHAVLFGGHYIKKASDIISGG